ncbi:MAG TPA: CYTH and CHAD domain-containing protein [Actinomycetota bacterium]
MREREVRLSAPGGFRTPAFGEPMGLVPAAQPAGRFQTSYFDTADLRLARWGCSLRHRTGEGWTVRLPSGGRGPLLVRSEHVFDPGGEMGRIPDAALDLVHAYVRDAPVRAVVRLRTVRHVTRLDNLEDTPMADLVLDEVSVLDHNRVVERFREIEVETTPATPTETLDVILEALKGAGAQPSDNQSKYARALGSRATQAPEVAVVRPGAEATAGDVVRYAIASSVDRYLRHEPSVRVAEDPEAVHQARVATRRLRSDLRTFGPLVDEQWTNAIRQELSWLAGLLGGARDADVLGERLQSRIESLPLGDQDGGKKLVAGFELEWTEARAKLLAALREPSYLRLLEHLIEAARSPSLTPEAERPAPEALRELLVRPWRSLRKAVRALGEDPADEALHQVRIKAKRVRYAAEAVAPVLGGPAERFARAAAGLQECLGEHQDAVVTGEILRERGMTDAGDVAFAAGQLAGLERAAALKARSQWPAAWKRLRRAARKLWP